MNGMFAKAINTGNPPKYFDVYDAASMSAVAILGWRSALEGGIPYDIPNFRSKEDRDKFKNDFASPFKSDKIKTSLAPSINGERTPSIEDIEKTKRDWAK